MDEGLFPHMSAIMNDCGHRRSTDILKHSCTSGTLLGDDCCACEVPVKESAHHDWLSSSMRSNCIIWHGGHQRNVINVLLNEKRVIMSHQLCWITPRKQRRCLKLYTQNPTRMAVDVGCKSVPTPHAHDVFPPLSFTVSQTRGFPSPQQVSGREHKNRTQLHLLTGEPFFTEKTGYLTVMIHSNWFSKGVWITLL